MADDLMTVTAYCKGRDISRTAFYTHKRHGALKGCFHETPDGRQLVIREAADRALDENVSIVHRAGGYATKAKHQRQRPEPEPDLIDAVDTLYILHRSVCETMGLTFSEGGPFTEDEIKADMEAAFNHVNSCLNEIQDETARDWALKSHVFLLAGIAGPVEMNYDPKFRKPIKSKKKKS